MQSRKYDQIEAVYSSLNLEGSYPELQSLPYEFVRALILARDLKINIRKRAIASFFESDRLRQASGGREQALGTNLHQKIAKKVTKRAPALVTAIRKFNGLTLQIEQLNKPEFNIPTPRSLPTDLKELRKPGSEVWEDVWTTRLDLKPPKWLESKEARDGIRAMLKLDRCKEEMKRLAMEANNLCNWYGRELASIETAVSQPQNARLSLQLEEAREGLLLLRNHWATPFASRIRFEGKIEEAVATPSRLGLSPFKRHLNWVLPVVNQSQDIAHDDLDQDATEENIQDDLAMQLFEDPDTTIVDYPDEDEAIMQQYLSNESDDEAVLPVSGVSWTQPTGLQLNTTLLATLVTLPVPEIQTIEFDSPSLDILSNPTCRLNDVCINGGAALLQHIVSQTSPDTASACAIFSTFDLDRTKHRLPLPLVWQMVS
ncbi:hypothetical protein MD484_g9047, partial [Candolleomyces efflorescens]